MEAVFARSEHGGHKVLQVSQGFEVFWPQGVKTYPSARRTIMALVNRDPVPDPSGYDPGLTFDRYFRKGRFCRWEYPAEDTIRLFGVDSRLVVGTPTTSVQDVPLVVHVPIGIPDHRWVEVRKIFYAGFARTALNKGYDPEDVLQELHKALLVRNQGKCPWNPAKSTFAYYVHMVCRGTMSNYHRRYSRLSRHEQFGVRNVEGESVDVSMSDLAVVQPQQLEAELRDVRGNLLNLVLVRGLQAKQNLENLEKSFHLLSEGCSQKEISVRLGVSPNRVSEAVRLIRSVAQGWRDGG